MTLKALADVLHAHEAEAIEAVYEELVSVDPEQNYHRAAFLAVAALRRWLEDR